VRPPRRGEEGQEAFNYLMANGGHYNQNTPLMLQVSACGLA
jgi:hypothetical protein